MHLRSWFLSAIPLLAQTPAAFEVASIKPNAANDHRTMIRMAPGGRFVATGVTLRQLISQGYNVRDFQITGGPGWIGSDRYDINAKAPEGTANLTPEQLRPMIRALVEERFQLKSRRETEEMAAYSLVQAKDGHKLKPNPRTGEGRPMVRMGRGQLTATQAPVSMFAMQLGQQLGRSITDKTGLAGEFDFNLEWTPEPGQGPSFGGPTPPPDAIPPSGGSGPTIFTALQEQLGLKLESDKGPVEIIVIESASKPTEN